MFRKCVRLMNCGEWLTYACSRRIHTNSTRILYSSFNKDLPNPNLPTPLSKVYSHDSDILLDQLKKAKNVDRLLELSSNHLDVMNAQHIVKLLQGIHEHAKKESFNSEVLMENQVFQAVCSRLMKIVRVLDPQETITVYKVLSALGIRNNSYVMTSILKMLGGHLNDMNLGQITFLNFLLSKQNHNPLVDGLRLALPLVLQVQIEQQLDSENISQVVDCLQLACRSRLKPAIIQKIVKAVSSGAKALSPSNAATVIFSLLSIDTPIDGYKELLNHSIEIVTRNIEIAEEKQVLNILKLCSVQGFYHSPFYFEVAKKVVSEKWGLESTWEVIRAFNAMKFCPPEVMDHFVGVLCLEADTMRTSPKYYILNCVEYLTATGYKPQHLSAALRIICSCKKKIEALHEKSPSLLIKFVSCLAMMGHFPEDLLAQILDEDYLFNAWSTSRKQGREKDFEKSVLGLAWSFVIYDQQDNFHLPSTILKSLAQVVCERFSNYDCPLIKFIENGLGGPQFLQSAVFTHDGIFIDHMLAMRSGNYPVSLQNFATNQSPSIRPQNLSFVEDYVLPADAKIITVIVAHDDYYCKDPEVLRGWEHLKITALSKKTFSPVVINYTTWRNLPDREKIPYLMQEIKHVMQEEQIAKTNTLF